MAIIRGLFTKLSVRTKKTTRAFSRIIARCFMLCALLSAVCSTAHATPIDIDFDSLANGMTTFHPGDTLESWGLDFTVRDYGGDPWEGAVNHHTDGSLFLLDALLTTNLDSETDYLAFTFNLGQPSWNDAYDRSTLIVNGIAISGEYGFTELDGATIGGLTLHVYAVPGAQPYFPPAYRVVLQGDVIHDFAVGARMMNVSDLTVNDPGAVIEPDAYGTEVPEPGSLLLFATALLAGACGKRRHKLT